MKAEIKRTNSGKLYVVLEADKNNIEELMDLTEFRKNIMRKDYEIVNFGGGSGVFGKNKDKHLDYYLNLRVQEK